MLSVSMLTNFTTQRSERNKKHKQIAAVRLASFFRGLSFPGKCFLCATLACLLHLCVCVSANALSMLSLESLLLQTKKSISNQNVNLKAHFIRQVCVCILEKLKAYLRLLFYCCCCCCRCCRCPQSQWAYRQRMRRMRERKNKNTKHFVTTNTLIDDDDNDNEDDDENVCTLNEKAFSNHFYCCLRENV